MSVVFGFGKINSCFCRTFCGVEFSQRTRSTGKSILDPWKKETWKWATRCPWKVDWLVCAWWGWKKWWRHSAPSQKVEPCYKRTSSSTSSTTMNMCMQLKRCAHDDGTNSGIDDFQMVLWTVSESRIGWLLVVPHFILPTKVWILFFMIQVAGVLQLRWHWLSCLESHWSGETFGFCMDSQHAMLLGWLVSDTDGSWNPVCGFPGGCWSAKLFTSTTGSEQQVKEGKWWLTLKESSNPLTNIWLVEWPMLEQLNTWQVAMTCLWWQMNPLQNPSVQTKTLQT